MNKSTRVIEVIEMTKDEECLLWRLNPYERKIKHGIEHWITDDGCNEIRLKGEGFYRPIYIIDS